VEEVFLSRIVYWSTLHWVESKHKRNPSSLWNPGHIQTYELTKDHVTSREWQPAHAPTMLNMSLTTWRRQRATTQHEQLLFDDTLTFWQPDRY